MVQFKINALGKTFTGSDGKEYVGKGNLSVKIGGSRFPVSLYASQWAELMTAENCAAIQAACKAGLKDGTMASPRAPTVNGKGGYTALAAYTAK